MLAEAVKACQACSLRAGCTSPIPGRGAPSARLFVVGGPPLIQEDQTGIPFGGASGQLLRDSLAANGIMWDSVYRTNSVKCYPGKKKPKVAEREACRPWLEAELSMWSPTQDGTVLIVGEDAVKTLFPKLSLSDARSATNLTYLGKPVVAILHPAFALRSPKNRMEFEDDVKKLGERLGTRQPTEDYRRGYRLATTEEELDEIFDLCLAEPILGLDTEFFLDNTMIGYSLSWAEGQAVYIPAWAPRAIDLLVTLCNLPKILVIHSTQADIPVILKAADAKEFIVDPWPWERTFDTCVAAYVKREPSVGLKPLTLQHWGIKTVSFEDIAGTPEEFVKLPLIEQALYAAGDADFSRRYAVEQCWDLLEPMLRRL